MHVHYAYSIYKKMSCTDAMKISIATISIRVIYVYGVCGKAFIG